MTDAELAHKLQAAAFRRQSRLAMRKEGQLVPENTIAGNALTAVVIPAGHDADAFLRMVLERFDMSLGSGLGKLKGKIFRIGHLGDFNDLMLAGTLSGVEMGLAASGVPFTRGGVTAALEYLASETGRPALT